MVKSTLCFVAVLALIAATAAYAQDFIGNDYRNVINGTWKDDYIEARGAGDDAFGKGGDDEIRMGTGNDLAYGGQETDEMLGGDGNDRLYAGCNGTCTAGVNNDLFGGNGDDFLAARNGNHDIVDGGPGYDTCYADIVEDDVSSCEDLHWSTP
jgi:hypothetical protein